MLRLLTCKWSEFSYFNSWIYLQSILPCTSDKKLSQTSSFIGLITQALTFCTYQGYKKLTSPKLSYTTANFTLYLFKFHFVRRQNIIFTFIIKLMGFLFYQRLPFKNNQGLDHYCVHGHSTLTPRNIYD